jgi:hypothetical protein
LPLIPVELTHHCPNLANVRVSDTEPDSATASK